MLFTPTRLLAPLITLLLLATACGSDGASATASVASLEDSSDPATATGAEVELSADEAALAFSACMRAEGLDFADIGVDANGEIDLRTAFQDTGIDPRSEEFRDGMDVCGDVLVAAGFGGGGGRAGLADDPETQDALVAYSDCIREQGFDVGDLQLGVPGEGGGQPTDGEGADGAPRGQGQDGFGDRNDRFALQLGLDPEDPEVAVALEACASIIDTAFSGIGPSVGDDS